MNPIQMLTGVAARIHSAWVVRKNTFIAHLQARREAVRAYLGRKKRTIFRLLVAAVVVACLFFLYRRSPVVRGMLAGVMVWPLSLIRSWQGETPSPVKARTVSPPASERVPARPGRNTPQPEPVQA